MVELKESHFWDEEKVLTSAVALGLSLLVVDSSGQTEKVMSGGHHPGPGGIGHASELGQILHGIVVEVVNIVDNKSDEEKGSRHGDSSQGGCCRCHSSRHVDVVSVSPSGGGFILFSLVSVTVKGQFTPGGFTLPEQRVSVRSVPPNDFISAGEKLLSLPRRREKELHPKGVINDGRVKWQVTIGNE